MEQPVAVGADQGVALRPVPAVEHEHHAVVVAVDDHAMDHLTYTDEHKSVADTGWWEEESRDDHRMVFVLHGREGSRRYALIRTDREWLLHLTKDQPMD